MSATPKSPAERVIAMAAAIGEVAVGRMKGPSRQKELIELRAGCAMVLREMGLSYPIIARLLGRGDHSTVIFSERRAARMLAAEPEGEFAWLIDALRAAARAGRVAQPVRAAVVARFVSAVETLAAPMVAPDDACRCGACREEAVQRARIVRGSARLAAALAEYRCAA